VFEINSASTLLDLTAMPFLINKTAPIERAFAIGHFSD
jgi:hypothetical protein